MCVVFIIIIINIVRRSDASSSSSSGFQRKDIVCELVMELFNPLTDKYTRLRALVRVFMVAFAKDVTGRAALPEVAMLCFTRILKARQNTMMSKVRSHMSTLLFPTITPFADVGGARWLWAGGRDGGGTILCGADGSCHV
jgi:hypothetical protein